MAAVMSDRQKEELAKRLFLGRNPAIAAAYKNDPRTILSSQMMGAGADMSPTKGGWAEGLSRAASGVAGGLFAKQQRDAYGAKDREQAAMENVQRLGDPTATGQGSQSAIMGGPAPPPVPPPAPPMPPPPRPSIGDPAIAAMAGGGAPPGGPPGIGDPNIAKIAGALGQGGGGLPPGGLPPPPGPVSGPNMASLSGTPTQPPMGTPPPNPMVAPGGPGAQAASSPNSLNRVAAALTPQPAMEDVGGLQAMPSAPSILARSNAAPPINEADMRNRSRRGPTPAPAPAPVVTPSLLAKAGPPPAIPQLASNAADDRVLGGPTPAPVPPTAPRAVRRAAAQAGQPAPSPATGLTPTTAPYVTNAVAAGVGPKTAAEIPEQFRVYKSSAWEPLENQYAQKYGVPVWMIRSIRLNGERSDWDQSSGADGGTRTPYQFTDKTRNLFIKNRGIDPWSSPEAAVESTAIHLADDLRATKGDERETIARFHAGPSKTNRGEANADYLARVTGKDASGAVIGGTGGAKPGYGPPAAAAVAGSQVNPVGEVPAAPNVDIPDLPAAQPEPVRQALPKQIQSLRLATARNLIRDNPNADPTLVAMASDADWEAGTKEEQSAREKAYDAEVQGIQAEDLSKRQLYNAVEETRQKQPIAERDLAVRQKYDLQGKEYTARTDAAKQEDTQRQETSERLAKELADRDAATALAISNAAKADANYRNSGAAQKDAEAARLGSLGAQSMLANIQKFRKAQDNAWTGGMQGVPVLGGVAQGMVGAMTGNQSYGEMSEASTDMGVARQQLMKGSTSDSDRTWLLQGLPSRGNSKSQNEGILQGLERTAQRQQEYWSGYSKAIAANGAQGRQDFQDRWNDYINSVSVQPGQKNYVSYEQWTNPEVRR